MGIGVRGYIGIIYKNIDKIEYIHFIRIVNTHMDYVGPYMRICVQKIILYVKIDNLYENFINFMSFCWTSTIYNYFIKIVKSPIFGGLALAY